MEINPNELFSPVIRIILFFTEQNDIDRSSYTIYDSLKAANIADCVSGKTEDPFILHQSKWYEADEYDVLKKLAARSQEAGMDVDKDRSALSGENDRLGLKYVQVDIPIPKILYQTITDPSFSSSQLLASDELSKLIRSNLFSVLDNRLTITRVIVEHLYKDKEMYQKMYSDYLDKSYDLLTSIRGFKMDRDSYIALVNTESWKTILMEMLNGMKIENDLEQHNAILRVCSYLFHWDNSFMNLIREVKNNIVFQITDLQNQKAYASSDSTSHQLGINISMKDLNICYMFDQLSMSFHFFQSNAKSLERQFNDADISPRLILDICFDEKMVENKKLEFTPNKFINSDYFTGISLHLINLNVELEIGEMDNKEYSMYLDNCDLQVFKSLPARLVHLEMKNMHLTKSIRIPHAFGTFVCRDTRVDEGWEIIVDKSNSKVRFVGVEGRIRHDFGVIVSNESSEIMCTHLSDEKIELFKMVNVCFVSKYACSDEIESLVLINADMSGIRTCFSGKCEKILVKNCCNAFNFRKMKSVNTLEIVGKLSKGFFDNLPITIQTLIITDTQMNFDGKLEKKLTCLKFQNIQVKSYRTFSLINECNSVTISGSTGTFGLFKKIELVFDNQYNSSQKFILEKDGQNICVNYAKMQIDDAFFNDFDSIALTNVKFTTPISLHLGDKFKELLIHKTRGKFKISGIVTTRVQSIGKTCFNIVNIAGTSKYDIKIENSMLLAAMNITCNLKHLILEDLIANTSLKVTIKNCCDHIKLKDYTGLLEMPNIPGFQRVLFAQADLDYDMMKHHLSLKGEFNSDESSLPQNISTLKLNNLVVGNQRVVHLPKNLVQINISGCSGAFNFAGLLNIENLVLEPNSVVVMENMTTIDASVHLSYISLKGSLNFPSNVSKLILTRVNFEGKNNVDVSSRCRSITIDHSHCKIHWYDAEESYPMSCTLKGVYEFTRDVHDGLTTFSLKDAQLAEEIVVPNNVQKVHLVNVIERQRFFIKVNELCKTLLIQSCAGVVICTSLMHQEEIVVSGSSMNALKLRFSSDNEATFMLCYEFENDQNEKILVHTGNLRSLSFEHSPSAGGITMPKLMDDEESETLTLCFVTFPHLTKGTSAYNVDTEDVNLMALLKRHLMIDTACLERLGNNRLIRIRISNLVHG